MNHGYAATLACLPAYRPPPLLPRRYALDIVLPDLKQPTKTQLEQAMKGHVRGQAELIGITRRRSDND